MAWAISIGVLGQEHLSPHNVALAKSTNNCYLWANRSRPMSHVEKISIALPAEMIALVKAAVNSGEYATTSEVVRDALRGWRLKRRRDELEIEELQRLVNEGTASGPSVESSTVLGRLRRKYADLAEAEK